MTDMIASALVDRLRERSNALRMTAERRARSPNVVGTSYQSVIRRLHSDADLLDAAVALLSSQEVKLSAIREVVGNLDLSLGDRVNQVYNLSLDYQTIPAQDAPEDRGES